MNLEERRIYDRAYWSKNRDKINARRRKRKAENKVEFDAKRKVYRKKNKEKIAETIRLYRTNNKDKVKIYNETYRIKNQSKVNARSRRYYQEHKKEIREKIKVSGYHKKYYATKQGKETRERYYRKNKGKIKLRSKISKQKQRKSLDDLYIIKLLCKETSLNYSDIRQYPELIEVKRLHILVIQALNQNKIIHQKQIS